MKLIQKRKNSKAGPHANMALFKKLEVFTKGSIEDSVDAARAIVALLYDPSKAHESLHGSLNKLRTQLCIITSDPMSKLPPSEPVFIEHVGRAIWEIKLMVHARDPFCYLGEPTSHGWENTELGLMPIMYKGTTAAGMIGGLFCECDDVREQCPCLLNGLPCINLCSCSGDNET